MHQSQFIIDWMHATLTQPQAAAVAADRPSVGGLTVFQCYAYPIHNVDER